MNTKSAAAFLGVHPSTLLLWRKSGVGPPFTKLSPKIFRYDQAELEAWLASRRSDNEGKDS